MTLCLVACLLAREMMHDGRHRMHTTSHSFTLVCVCVSSLSWHSSTTTNNTHHARGKRLACLLPDQALCVGCLFVCLSVCRHKGMHMPEDVSLCMLYHHCGLSRGAQQHPTPRRQERRPPASTAARRHHPQGGASSHRLPRPGPTSATLRARVFSLLLQHPLLVCTCGVALSVAQQDMLRAAETTCFTSRQCLCVSEKRSTAGWHDCDAGGCCVSLSSLSLVCPLLVVCCPSPPGARERPTHTHIG